MAIRARGFITLCFLVAAIFCYATGFIAGLFFVAVAGGIFELLFWANLLRKRRWES